MEKFINKLQVLNDPVSGPPDLRGHLRSPIVVARNALAVAGQVESGPAFPVRAKYGAYTSPETPWPTIKWQDHILLWVPRPTRHRSLWITRTIEANNIFASILRRHRNQRERPGDGDQPPPSFRLRQAKARLHDVRSKCALVRQHHAFYHAPAPFTRWSATRSNTTRQFGKVVSAPICVPGAGRWCVRGSCNTCSPDSSSVMPSFVTAAQCLTCPTVVAGLKRWCSVSPLKVTETSTRRQRCRCALMPVA